MFDSIENFTPTDTYFVKVDMEAVHTYTTEGGMEFYHPHNAGDMYQNKPMHGELTNAPKNATIPIGSTVYLNYLASESFIKIGGDEYYIIKEGMIVAYDVDGERKAYKSVLLTPIKEDDDSNIIVDLSEDELMDAVMNGGDKKTNKYTTCGEVIDADNEWLEKEFDFTLSAGDIIEYESALDWEYIVNRTSYYYIQWANRIIRKGDEIINTYNEILPIPKYIEKNGLIIQNTGRFTPVVDGQFKGKKVLPETKNIDMGKYIKSEFIYGHLE